MDTALYIGLMSGTSLDGIDVALVDFSDGAKLVGKAHHPMPALLTAILLQLSQSNAAVSLEQVGHLDTALGQTFADAVTAFIARHGIDPRHVRAIGSHGQTVRHNPHGEQPFSLQLGDANIIAERTGITAVADFRRRDVAAGGQGAPLVPAFHRSLFADSGKNLAVINIGGIANITFLPAYGPVTGFDTGPGNGLMDAWCQRHWQRAFDDNGAKAALGVVDGQLLERLLSDPWLQLPPPKSTGRDVFQLDWLDQQLQGFALPAEAVLRTLNAFTAHSIAAAVLASNEPVDAVYVCGGGVHNALLLKCLQQLLPCPCMSTADVGVDPDFVEAMAFAWLAKQCLQGKPGNLVEVTGAAGPRVLGAIYQA